MNNQRNKEATKTKRAKKLFKQWQDGELWISDLTVRPDEIFVPIWDERLQKINYRYYVSNYGQVLSFINPEPKVLKNYEVTGKYLECGNKWRVNRLVWFSFMVDAIRRNQQLDPEYDEIRSINDLRKLRDVNIHHVDKNPQNNQFINLRAYKTEIHDMLHKIDKTKDEIERLKLISKIPSDSKSCRIYMFDDRVEVKEARQIRFTERGQQEFWNMVAGLNAALFKDHIEKKIS